VRIIRIHLDEDLVFAFESPGEACERGGAGQVLLTTSVVFDSQLDKRDTIQWLRTFVWERYLADEQRVALMDPPDGVHASHLLPGQADLIAHLQSVDASAMCLWIPVGQDLAMVLTSGRSSAVPTSLAVWSDRFCGPPCPSSPSRGRLRRSSFSEFFGSLL
jgi:hypothetical protein